MRLKQDILTRTSKLVDAGLMKEPEWLKVGTQSHKRHGDSVCGDR